MIRSISNFRISKFGILLFLVGLGILLAPWYAWSSGGMQPGHIVLAIAIVIALPWMLPSSFAEVLLICYLVYAAIRESFQVLVSGEAAGLLPVLHILFGYCIYKVTQRALGRCESLRSLSWWFVGSTIFALCGVLVLGTGSITVEAERAVGTFNNPNQLGYFGVLVASAVLILWARNSMAQKWMLAVVLVCTYLCILSLSKSAMGSVVLVPLAYFGLASRRSTHGVFIWAFGGLIFLYILAQTGLLGKFYISDFAAYNRIVNAANESDSSLAVRGYTVLADASWWQVLFGMASQTVADLRGGYEVHSTYMAPIASYGLIGGGLFMAFLAIFNYRFLTNFGAFMYLGAVAPMMLYGIAHNGGRTPLFWVFLGLATAYSTRQSGGRASDSRRAGIARS